MKKNYFFTLLLTLCFSALTFGQVSLPHYESFDYTVAADLSAQTNWENYSGSSNPIDIVSGSLSYSGLASSTGNSINMVGGSEDSRILFNEVTSGEVYVSFLMNVTDISNMSDFTDGGYFAILGSSTNSFRSRFWVKPTVDASSTTVDFAYTTSSSGSGFGQTQNINGVVLVVLSYNVDTGVANGWINPASADFAAGSAPTPDFTNTDGSPTTIDRFLLRQDSTGETPNMLIDELRIGSTWAAVTPSGSVSTDPALTINAPSNNQVFPATTTDVNVAFTVENFNLSGDNGSEMTDNTGDGYILGTLTKDGVLDGTKNIFSTTTLVESVTPGSTYIITAELVDNSGNSLSPQVEKTVTFSVELPCDLTLGTITAVCDVAPATTYTGSIAFTGGNTGVDYTITAPAGVTVGGDDPDTAASGVITFSGIAQGADAMINISGDATSSCDFDRTFFNPICTTLPISDDFNYTVGANLSDSDAWSDLNSGDNIVVASGNLDYSGLVSSTGNSITFDENGAEAFTQFADITSGSVYASFLFKVTGFQTNGSPDLTDGGYFAALASSTSAYDARLWVRPNPDTAGTTFDIGFGHESSNPTFTTETYNVGDVIFVVMSYDLDNSQTNVWINPATASFGLTAPTATITTTDNFPASEINTFILRQDSDKETPFFQVDELRVDSTWASVTPSAVASVGRDNIEGFATYPNPITDKRFTISTSSSNKKKVEVYNVLGKKVFATTFSGLKKEVDVTSINTGVYILKVTENGKTATKKLVIR